MKKLFSRDVKGVFFVAAAEINDLTFPGAQGDCSLCK